MLTKLVKLLIKKSYCRFCKHTHGTHWCVHPSHGIKDDFNPHYFYVETDKEIIETNPHYFYVETDKEIINHIRMDEKNVNGNCKDFETNFEHIIINFNQFIDVLLKVDE